MPEKALAGQLTADLFLQGLGEGKVAASSFRTSYVPLNKQADFINGMQVGCFTAVCHPTAQALSTSFLTSDASECTNYVCSPFKLCTNHLYDRGWCRAEFCTVGTSGAVRMSLEDFASDRSL